MIERIQQELFALKDTKFRDFQAKLIPSVSIDSMIGVRTPQIRKMAKDYYKSDDLTGFLKNLPHKYFEENQLHAFILSEMKNIDECLLELDRFLPYIDNWATCDQLSPKCFKNNKDRLISKIDEWLESDNAYTVRFAIKSIMENFLADDFKTDYLDKVASVKREEYYVKMMISWFFATALAKQYDKAIAYLEEKRLDLWVHNKTIQKAVESYRITDEQKRYLKSLKLKNN